MTEIALSDYTAAQVHALLTQSRAAHQRKQKASGRTNAKGDVIAQPNYPVAEGHLADALDLRLQAHALDPDHLAPAWQDDKVPHETLVAFMQRYASIQAPQPVVLSIAEIDATTTTPAGDKRDSLAYALLLLESGWIQPADLQATFAKLGQKMPHVHRVDPGYMQSLP